jgi:antitoxin (DNA-binding transcriptional repressor) of toxin-antitoxin stability system
LDGAPPSAYEVTTMGEMKHVGVREFRDHATTYLSGSHPIAISKHGRVIGLYIPMKRDKEAARRALDKLEETVERILEETGMTEDELADMFDMRRPSPE